jgi:glycosyltransferase involved in cell wall biosynthesis
MKILIVHNRYRESGGEDRSVDLECELLARHSHTVMTHIEDNSTIVSATPLLAARTIWSSATYRHISRAITRNRIDLVHVHNTLPLVSPAVYHAARATGVPVVQTLHNYRLMCPNALCFRDSNPCVECVGRRAALPALRHACYKNSLAATATVAAMLWIHKAARTWRHTIDTFIAPSQFAREMFVRGGLDPRRIVVKPHFVYPDPGPGAGSGGYAVFVGRLSREKGIEVLLDAWQRLRQHVPLVIVGDGPLASDVAAEASNNRGVRWMGRQTRSEVQRVVADASFLVFPSLAYETFGQAIAEAYASGTPVIASSSGAAAELVNDGETGLLFDAGDAKDLAAHIDSLIARPEHLARMRTAARLFYEERLTAEANYRQLSDIYRHALTGSHQAALSA